jgi:glutamate racemase
MNVHPASPIGVFDSGLGGLSIVRQLQAELPRESILYAADSRFCPYGERSLAEIQERTLAMVGYLVENGAKLIIVACNTATAAAIEILREIFMVPIVALEPAVKPAVALTRTGKIAVLATPRTVGSSRLQRLIDRYGEGYDIRSVGIPGLADCIESGDVDGLAVRGLLEAHVGNQVREGVDVIVLGCTHYPFVRHVIADLAGPGVSTIDSGNAVARRAREVLMQSGGLAGIDAAPALTIHTTGDPELLEPIIARMIDAPVSFSETHRDRTCTSGLAVSAIA